MTTLLTIDQMTEEDIKLQYITPALLSKWDRHKITMETKVTDGRINLRGNMASREKPKKADYLLYLSANNPIAVVEAKDHKHSISYGLQQAMTYAVMLDLPFAYSSNGDGFVEHDFLTGKERTLSLDEFPSEQELFDRYQKEKQLTKEELNIINQPYYSGMGSNTPRYYQRIAINRTLDAIALGQSRILLVMATGTGKTFTAFQIVYRLLKAGIKKKILYLADRNLLVDQTILQDFAPLDKTIHKINFAKDDKTTIGAYEVYFALYQQMVGDNDEEKFSEWFAPDFFDLIIVDECHRGSAKEESRWRKVLEYFKGATQIGMTATPKETKYVSNINYFGDPIYTYSLNDGINDGFLAPFKVINITTDISDGWRPRAGQRDYYGNEIEDRIYNNRDYDYSLVLEDRTREVAETITAYLKRTDRMQKTIVFCATEDHADRMRMALVNCNQDMVQKNPDYVVRITGSDDYGRRKIKPFCSVGEKYPVIATTSELLTTGADCKMTKLIVLDKMVNSMTTFKQIIGRGTRLRPNEGKMSFMVMDFRNVTHLFADPDWDGPIEVDPDFSGKPGGNPNPPNRPTDPPTEPTDGKTVYYVREDGCKVSVIHESVAVYDAGGKLLRQENIIDYTKTNILEDYASLGEFIKNWKNTELKSEFAKHLAKVGIDIDKLKREQNMADVDDFDFICYIAYGKKPLTRKERANNIKKKDIFSKYSGAAKEVLETLLDKYMDLGIKEIEKTAILKLADFAKFGTPKKIADLFGGKEQYLNAVLELKKDLYEDEVG